MQAVVSAVGRDLGDGFGPVWIQHQSTINHGNSGGPLLDMDGNVVGVNTLSMDHLSSGESVQGIFFAIPADLAQSVAAKLIGQLQGTSATALHVTQPRASRFKTAFYTVTLPAGWISSRLSRGQPVLISRDQLVQVLFSTVATRNRPSAAGLRQATGHALRALGKVRSLTFSTVAVGRLRGISGTATYARKPYRLVLVAYPTAPAGTCSCWLPSCTPGPRRETCGSTKRSSPRCGRRDSVKQCRPRHTVDV